MSNLVRVCAGFAIMLAASGAAEAHGFRTFYTFTDGSRSAGQLLRDASGNLYGVSTGGGSNGVGSVFELSPGGALTAQYDFSNAMGQASQPIGGVVMDGAGNLYGEANNGGAFNCNEISNRIDCGSVYKLAPDGTITTLYGFQGGPDGDLPNGGLLIDKAGNLYGTTRFGGSENYCGTFGGGCGTVFKIAADGTHTVLYTFQGHADGGEPVANLVADHSGNLYGTSTVGGAGYGAVFKLTASGTESSVYTFQDGADGGIPESGVTFDAAGNLYGTTIEGGSGGGYGTIYKLTLGGTLTVLHAFSGVNQDGIMPDGNVLIDKKGDLYGETREGGIARHGRGTIYKVAQDGTYSQVYLFRSRVAGDPVGGLVQDAKGNLYGSALEATSPFPGIIYTARK